MRSTQRKRKNMNVEHLTKEDWLAIHHRPDMVSASQVFTLTGENTYESPYTLWARKMGTVPWPETNIAMRRGHALENLCAELYEEQTEIVLHDLGDYAIVRHPDHPWLFCTPDRLRYKNQPVEFKTTSNFKAWVEDAPLSAQTQLQIQMACLGASDGGIGALLGGFSEEFLTFEFQRHDKLIEQLIEIAAEFRERCMIGDSPDVDGSDSTSLTLKTIYPRPTPDNTVALPATAAMWASEWAGVKETAKILEDREKMLKNQLIQAIGNGEYGQCGDLMFSYKQQVHSHATIKVDPIYIELLKEAEVPFEFKDAVFKRVLREVKPKAKKGELVNV